MKESLFTQKQWEEMPRDEKVTMAEQACPGEQWQARDVLQRVVVITSNDEKGVGLLHGSGRKTNIQHQRFIRYYHPIYRAEETEMDRIAHACRLGDEDIALLQSSLAVKKNATAIPGMCTSLVHLVQKLYARLLEFEKGALIKETEDDDYVLKKEAGSAWITVGSISVYVSRTDEGVAVDLYAKGMEMEGELAACYAFESEALLQIEKGDSE